MAPLSLVYTGETCKLGIKLFDSEFDSLSASFCDIRCTTLLAGPSTVPSGSAWQHYSTAQCKKWRLVHVMFPGQNQAETSATGKGYRGPIVGSLGRLRSATNLHMRRKKKSSHGITLGLLLPSGCRRRIYINRRPWGGIGVKRLGCGLSEIRC